MPDGALQAPGPALFSILTPSLNQGRFIEDCVGSVERQTYRPVEHIVVDGGSTDGTLDIVAAHPGVRLIVDAGSSQASALNRALRESRGELIGWINSDDALFAVDTLSVVAAAFLHEPDAIAVVGNAVIVDANGTILRHVRSDPDQLGTVGMTSPITQPAVFLRRSAIEPDFVREDLEVMLDHELWLRLRAKGQFARVDRILAIDRDHPDRKVRRLGDRWVQEHAEVAASYGLPVETDDDLRKRTRRWIRRTDGLSEMLLVDRRYRLAFDGKVDATWRRLVRQLLVPHARIHSI